MRKWTSMFLVLALVVLFAVPVSATERLSTGLRNALAGERATLKACISGAGVALVEGGAGTDSITDSGNGIVTAGFEVGDFISVRRATAPADNIDSVACTAVAAGTITLPAGTFTTGQVAGTYVVVCATEGGSWRDLFKDSVIRIYSGSQPSSSDAAETGTLLVTITVSAGTCTATAAANCLEFGTPASGIVSKATTETWSGTAVATGTAGWFRLYDNAYTTGASTTAIRFDGSVGTSGADLNLSSTSITSGATVTIDTFAVTIPEY